MERNLIEEMNMMRQNGAKPGSADIARRCGIDRHAARCWNGGRRTSCFFCSILNARGAQKAVTIRTTS